MRQTTVVGFVAGVGIAMTSLTSAQVSPPNRAGVAMGHLHFHVRDVEANQKFWVALGGTPARALGMAHVVKFPGLLIVLSPGESSGTTEGSVVNHLALRVKTFAQIETAGLKVERRSIEGRQSGTVVSPSGDRVELFEENAEQTRFKLDAGWTDAVANRHNEPLTAPVVPHHLHLDVPQDADAVAQAWYVKIFGGVPGTRLRYQATDLPGMNFNFSGYAMPMAPTKGRTLDHIGFEVRNLQAFCKTLAADGVKLDQAYATHDDGVATALLTDPWGTSIELTEGLSRWQ
jgi:catechol 2,3-dioxygenase-like lactoylglutathione lyase family enzyme